MTQSKKKWRTMFDAFFNPEQVFTKHGDKVRPEFVLSVGEDGRKCLSKVRDIDIQAFINSFAPGCDMSVVINKLKAGLIPTKYDEHNCLDMSLMPKSIVDAMQSIRAFRDGFGDMPANIQKAFGYDPNIFIQSFIDGTFNDALKNIQLGKDTGSSGDDIDKSIDKPIDKPIDSSGGELS